jgi:putative RecB family exonuclease
VHRGAPDGRLPAATIREVWRMEAASQVYSYSRITTFEQCARRFRYRYVDGVKEAFRGVEAFMGQQVHSTIEWLFNERTRSVEPTSEQAVSYYCTAWDTEAADGAARVHVVKRDMSLESYRRMGAEVVAAFHAERFVGDTRETVATEKHFAVSFNGHRFQGFIDRLARDADGLLHVIDYKTGARAPRTFAGKEADQLRAYGLGLFIESDAAELELVLDFVRAGKTLRQRIRRDEAAAVERMLSERIDAVEASSVFPPNPGVLCGWCGYNDICEASGEGWPRRGAGASGAARG